MLARLPARPPNVLKSLSPDDLNVTALDEYLVPSVHESSTSTYASHSCWDDLAVVAAVDTTVLRTALDVAHYTLCQKAGPMCSGPKFVNAVAGLLKLAFQLSAQSMTIDAKRKWVVVKAFLWTVWQRSLMLHFWRKMEDHLRLGYDYSNRGMEIRGLAPIPEIFAQRFSQHLEDQNMAQYMCSWAFELLRNDRACITTDLRRFHWCYKALFGGRPPRCQDGQQQCGGGSPENCQRFKGAVVLDQSAHNSICNKSCGRLFWDRTSFINVSGAKAVCLTATDDEQLRYRKTSGKTLAISHVWSHGEGGRPDTTGFNVCLHHRYRRLAEFFGCDSYWMDTPCIPSEKVLRSECIGNINTIFTQSRVTLVCDRDLMDIDVSNLTMDLQEAILATVLVCDWNVRAWTLLEAMRGRHNVHLLCKGNEVVSFQETLKSVHKYGRIDLDILFLTTQHLLPPPPIDDWEVLGGSMIDEQGRRIQLGFVSLGEASILLSHRHATRDGDDVVIWSLLANDVAIKSAAELWKSQIGAEVQTGFLMSSSPRLQGHTGLGWAPSCPALHPPASNDSNHESMYLAYDGLNTQRGIITSEGLQAKWLIHKFLPSSADYDFRFPRNVAIAARYLQHYRWGAFLRPGQLPGPRYVPAPYQGMAKEALVAICGSNDGRRWEWKSVYEWDISDPLPDIYIYKRDPDAPPGDFLLEDVLLI